MRRIGHPDGELLAGELKWHVSVCGNQLDAWNEDPLAYVLLAPCDDLAVKHTLLKLMHQKPGAIGQSLKAVEIAQKHDRAATLKGEAVRGARH